MNSIIPGLIPDIVCTIVFHLPNDDKVAFSGVSRGAYELFSNGVYFANLFKLQHPVLTKHGFRFEILTGCHPSNCWKVACCVDISTLKVIDVFFLQAIPFKNSFLQQAIPFIREPLEAKKSKLELQLKEICGNFPFDPESPIDEAWKSKERYHQEIMDVYDRDAKQLAEIGEIFKLFYSPDDCAYVIRLCKERCDNFFVDDNDGEVSDAFSEEQLKVIHFDFIPHYRVLTNFYKECNFWGRQRSNHTDSYYKLENQRSRLDIELQDVDKELNSLTLSSAESIGLKKHGRRLENEYMDGLRREAALTCIPILEECLDLMNAIVGQSKEATPEAMNSIHNLINSCNCWQSTKIWRDLYFCCADGIIEDQWAEKHFPQFLTVLQSIISNQISARKGEFEFCTGQKYKKEVQ